MDRRIQTRNAYGVAEHETLVGICARPIPLKGIEWSLSELQTSLTNHPNLKILIAGWNANCSSGIHEAIEHFGRERVSLVRHFSEMSDFFSAIDIHVHTPVSRFAEGFGNVFAEGLFSGRAAIYTRSGLTSDLNVNTFQDVHLIEFGNSPQFQSALKSAIEFASVIPRSREIPGLGLKEMVDNYVTEITQAIVDSRISTKKVILE